MVRVLLLSAGGRGDVEPICAIAKELLKDSKSQSSGGSRHEFEKLFVDFFVQSDFQSLVKPFECHPSVRVFPFPFTSNDFYRTLKKNEPLGPSRKHSDLRMHNVEKLSVVIGQLILPCLGQVLHVLENYEANESCIIITAAFTRQLALLLAHHRATVNVVMLHLQPLLPNRLFPSYRTHRREFVQRCIELTSCDETQLQSLRVELSCNYEESYWMIEQALEDWFLKERMVEVCEQVLGTHASPYSFQELQKMLTGRHPRIWVANAYTNHLIPRLAGQEGLGPNIWDLGPLADAYVPFGQESFDTTLHEFLSFDDKPLCIGFGSMPFHNIGAVLGACKSLKTRAVLVGDVFRRIPETHPAVRFKRVICVSAAPYALLLPRCSMMLCHGGIGVVQVCLRAGIPCLVSPLMGDQFALAQLLQSKGVGVQCGSKLSDITTQDIVDSFRAGEACFSRCERMMERIRRDDDSAGAQTAAHAIVALVRGFQSS